MCTVTYLNSSNETVTINEGSGNLTFDQISDANNDVSVRDSSGNAVDFNIGTVSPQMSNSNKLKVGIQVAGGKYCRSRIK